MVPKSEDIYFVKSDIDNEEISKLEVEIDKPETGEEVDVYCLIEGIRPAPEDGDIELEISMCG